MQLMPAAIDQFQVEDAFDPKQNVEAGAQFLKQLLEKYKGDLSLVLAAYNAGPAAVDQANGIPRTRLRALRQGSSRYSGAMRSL